MTTKRYLCDRCKTIITRERPPFYINYKDGTQEIIDNDPDPPEHCGNCHSSKIIELTKEGIIVEED